MFVVPVIQDRVRSIYTGILKSMTCRRKGGSRVSVCQSRVNTRLNILADFPRQFSIQRRDEVIRKQHNYCVPVGLRSKSCLVLVQHSNPFPCNNKNKTKLTKTHAKYKPKTQRKCDNRCGLRKRMSSLEKRFSFRCRYCN